MKDYRAVSRKKVTVEIELYVNDTQPISPQAIRSMLPFPSHFDNVYLGGVRVMSEQMMPASSPANYADYE